MTFCAVPHFGALNVNNLVTEKIRLGFIGEHLHFFVFLTMFHTF